MPVISLRDENPDVGRGSGITSPVLSPVHTAHSSPVHAVQKVSSGSDDCVAGEVEPLLLIDSSGYSSLSPGKVSPEKSMISAEKSMVSAGSQPGESDTNDRNISPTLTSDKLYPVAKLNDRFTVKPSPGRFGDGFNSDGAKSRRSIQSQGDWSAISDHQDPDAEKVEFHSLMKPVLLDDEEAIARRNVSEESLKSGSNSMWELGQVGFFKSLCHLHGTRFMWGIVIYQNVIRGFVRVLFESGTFWIFQDLQIHAADIQKMKGVIMAMVLFKPMIALMSDFYPIGGYNKWPWIMISFIFGLAGAIVTTIAPLVPGLASMHVLLFSLAGIHFGLCVGECLVEAAVMGRIQENPATGPDLLSFVVIYSNVLGVAALAILALSLRYLEHGSMLAFASAILCFAVGIWASWANLLNEPKITDRDRIDMLARKKRVGPIVWLAVILVLFCCILTAVSIMSQNIYLCGIISLVAFVILQAFNVIFFKGSIAKFNAFLLIQASLYVDTDSAAFYFYTDNRTHYPDGPHFSREFVTMGLGCLALFASLFCTLFYNRYMRTWRVRSLLVLTACAWFVLSTLDCILFTRLNVKWGIPDWFFVTSTGAFKSVINTWSFMPLLLLYAQLCTPGLEATMLSVQSGFHNIGGVFSEIWGACLLHYFRVEPSGQPGDTEQFDKLWMVSLIAACIGMTSVAVIPWLVPDVRQTEKFKGGKQGYPTDGSFWEQYFGTTPSATTTPTNKSRTQDPKYRLGTESPARSRIGGQPIQSIHRRVDHEKDTIIYGRSQNPQN